MPAFAGMTTLGDAARRFFAPKDPSAKVRRPKPTGRRPQAQPKPTEQFPIGVLNLFKALRCLPAHREKAPPTPTRAPLRDRSRAAVQGERRRGSIGGHQDQFGVKFRFCQYNSLLLLIKGTSILPIRWLSSRATPFQRFLPPGTKHWERAFRRLISAPRNRLILLMSIHS
jgi:hypothetical protein